MVQKAPGAYQTISEVSVQLDVPAHVLRFWESKFSALKPMKRSGGRRYYRTEDIHLLQTIKSLLYDEGYTIKGAQNTLKKRRAAPSSGVLMTRSTAQNTLKKRRAAPLSAQPDEAAQPVTAAQGPAADAHLDKAEALLREADKQVTGLLGQLGR